MPEEAPEKGFKSLPRTDPTGTNGIIQDFQNGILQHAGYLQSQIVYDVKAGDPNRDAGSYADTILKIAYAIMLSEEFMELTDYAAESYGAGAFFADSAAAQVCGANPPPWSAGDADWRVIDALKARDLSVLRGFTERLSNDTVMSLADGVQKGEGIPKLTARVQDVFGDKMIAGRAQNIARTEVQFATDRGTLLRYWQQGIVGARWLATADDRTCVECQDLDGQIFTLEEADAYEKHPSCRCCWSPVCGNILTMMNLNRIAFPALMVHHVTTAPIARLVA